MCGLRGDDSVRRSIKRTAQVMVCGCGGARYRRSSFTALLAWAMAEVNPHVDGLHGTSRGRHISDFYYPVEQNAGLSVTGALA